MKKAKVVDVHFRDGFRLPQAVDAHAAAQRLRELHEKNGDLTAPQVVEEAESPDSPLHDFFEWDDEKAADAYRRWQARHLLGAVMLTVEQPDGELIDVRQFLHVEMEMNPSGDTEPRYLELDRVLSDSDLRQQQIELAMDELGRWVARWAILSELDPCRKAIKRWQGQFCAKDQAA